MIANTHIQEQMPPLVREFKNWGIHATHSSSFSPSLIPVSFLLVLEEKCFKYYSSHSCSYPSLCYLLWKIPSLIFPSLYPRLHPPSSWLQLSDQTRTCSSLLYVPRSPSLRTLFPLLFLLPAKRLNRVICYAYTSSPPTRSSSQSGLALALRPLKSFSGMSPVTC